MGSPRIKRDNFILSVNLRKRMSKGHVAMVSICLDQFGNVLGVGLNHEAAVRQSKANGSAERMSDVKSFVVEPA